MSESVKKIALNLKKALKEKGHDVTLGHIYEIIADVNGFRNWNTMSGVNSPEKVITALEYPKPNIKTDGTYVVSIKDTVEARIDLSIVADSPAEAYSKAIEHVEEKGVDLPWEVIYVGETEPSTGLKVVQVVSTREGGERFFADAGRCLQLRDLQELLGEKATSEIPLKSFDNLLAKDGISFEDFSKFEDFCLEIENDPRAVQVNFRKDYYRREWFVILKHKGKKYSVSSSDLRHVYDQMSVDIYEVD